MAANSNDNWSLEDDKAPSVSLEEARAHDAYWEAAHSRESYFRAGLDYEDYAAAYCVGSVGFMQYGGDYGDAEKSLISNWVRLKGDARLSLDEARLAFRAAWDHAAAPVALDQEAALPWSAYVARFLVSARQRPGSAPTRPAAVPAW